MASVCRQVGDFHPNNRQLQQLHQPLCNWYHLVTASNHLPISQGQHDLSCWMSRLFISKTVMLWVVVGKQLFQRELVWVVWFMVIPHTTWLSWIIRCKVTKTPGVHSEWTVPQNDLLIKNEALCLRGRCAVVFCNIADTHFHGNLNEFKVLFFRLHSKEYFVIATTLSVTGAASSVV